MNQDFERDGWQVARGVLSARDLAEIAEVFTTLIPEGAALPTGPDGVIGEVAGAARVYEPMARIATDARFGVLAADALGASRVQLLQDSLLYKPAIEGGTVHWHQDYTYFGFLSPARVATVRIALLPERVESGCMRAVSGSHHWGLIRAAEAFAESQVDSLLPSLSDEQREAVAHASLVELEPGDVSIHHCLTLHGSGRNLSGAPRRTILLRMFDSACRVDASRLPVGAESYFPVDADCGLATSAFPVVFG